MSYSKKWTIHDIIQNIGFHPTKTHPCVMMRENLKPNCCDSIAVYVDDLFIPTQSPEDIGALPKAQITICVDIE